MINQQKLHAIGNVAGLVIICVLLTFAFVDQLVKHDLPCPLCLLQRICFVAVGLSICMNLCSGIKTSHYGLMILSALLGLSISIRQLYLHVTPGDPGYGQLFWGLHFYAWSAISFVVILVIIAIALLLNQGFIHPTNKKIRTPLYGLMTLFLLLILANGVSTFMECGFTQCPDNPVQYYY